METLTYLLAKIGRKPNCSLVMKVVNRLEYKDITRIYYEVYLTAITKLSELVISIVHASIKVLLMVWEGYYKVQDRKFMLKDLQEFLKKNLDYVKEKASEKVVKANLSIVHEKVFIELLCPYIKLKSVFYSKVHPIENSIINFNPVPHIDQQTNYDMAELVNWPCIEIILQLPNLIISRSNMNKTEFKLVTLIPDFKLKVKTESTELKYSEVKRYEEDASFPGGFVSAFIKQLKCKLSNPDCIYSSNLKNSVLSILSAFEKDVSLCTEEIQESTEYFYNLSKYPYARFLAQSTGIDFSYPLIKHEEQISLYKNSENIRLQQVFNPYVKFCLTAFNVTYDLDEKQDYVFPISGYLMHDLFHNIIIRCCLCNFQCDGIHFKEKLNLHLNSVHSDEPDWCCPVCKKHFTMQFLTSNRWQHDCEKEIFNSFNTK